MAVNLDSDVASGLYNASLATQAGAKSDNSTLSTDDFWKLIAAELKYQDMSNPMDNAAMMEQITQMSNMSTMNSMATAISNFSTVINNLSSVTLTTYSTGLLGREVTVVTKTDEDGKVVETKKGIVTGVDLTGATSVYVDGKKYELSSIMAIGDVPKVDTDDKTDSTDKTEDTDDKTDSTDKTEGTDDKTQALKLQSASLQLQKTADTTAGVQFSDRLLQEAQKAQSVQFSKHAARRVQERGINMTDNLLNDLNQAVQKARAKGARDVVIIGESGAFIVNVPNNVVVTTMSGTEMKENIFTNIDSAVLM